MAEFKDCPYREGTASTLQRHEEMLSKMDERVNKLETTVCTIDEILKRLEVLVNKLTNNINTVIFGAIVIPIITSIVMNSLKQ